MLKYLQFFLGEEYSLSESDPYGLMLFNLLRRPVSDSRKDEVVAKYTGRFAVHYGSYSPQQFGLKNLTGKTVYQFNNFVHSLIKLDLHCYVDLMTDHGNQVKYSIECFMRKYGFEESDIAYDTLLKSYQRFVEERKASKKKAAAVTPRKALKDLQKKLTTMVATTHLSAAAPLHVSL
ncbi:hypothetical protein [Hymenobacter metallicola]|uniref:hypothetical protein n=1 Tax=Hymenobacter metallicola TaxID=2563114 RepID=UPI00107FC247|nr:hypothetical protein [Hymenobacter metallicola]